VWLRRGSLALAEMQNLSDLSIGTLVATGSPSNCQRIYHKRPRWRLRQREGLLATGGDGRVKRAKIGKK
jgi:hypothetical protein